MIEFDLSVSLLDGEPLILVVSWWRWSLSVQIPRFRLDERLVEPPGQPGGDLVVWSEAKTLRSKQASAERGGVPRT